MGFYVAYFLDVMHCFDEILCSKCAEENSHGRSSVDEVSTATAPRNHLLTKSNFTAFKWAPYLFRTRASKSFNSPPERRKIGGDADVLRCNIPIFWNVDLQQCSL